MATVRATASESRVGWSLARLGGLAGLGFAVGLLIQNGVLLSGSPLPDATLDEVASFYTQNSTRVSIATGWVAINVPLLLLFVCAASNRLRKSPAGELWAQVALAGVTFLLAMFSIVTFLQAILAARADELAADHQALGIIWDLHSGAFALNTLALAILVGALSIGSFIHPLVPRWAAWIGIASAAMLLLNSVLAVNVIEGSSIGLIGFAGFLLWVAWLVIASVRLLRLDPEA